MIRNAIYILLLTFVLLLAACGQTDEDANANTTEEESTGSSGESETAGETPEAESESVEPEGGTLNINYLGETYEVPANPSIVITGSLEAMEDALVLGVEPIGAISVGGEFPEIFSSIVGSTESIGEKTQPNIEKILSLNPDVILSTTKFPEDVSSKLEEITTVIPVSHISTNWKENLLLMGELSGKKEEAEAILADYESQLTKVKEEAGEKLADKTAVAVRIRGGNIMIYSKDTAFNPSLYDDLELQVPEIIDGAGAQEAISLEKFSELNPDYIFVQFAETENADNPEALTDLESNPIWQSLQAVKEDQVYVNVVDPLAQGGTAWSKMEFLKAFEETVIEE
ncbi:bacillibactin-binding protein [Gracilibacillus ureilyticus]|uniref:Bacillibactin-binding protein n=1 Tax=Gracilibacillus ureilyticus TaxID=531814 RepID=A0A1H9MUS7_9BACI|nr:iron-hydroxamate ABC transporter substrate-binding protein [Gracilibacillus ureilyticus]SER26863.1 bacillibactin-binding protein [Gracilibacillus ureilyticus]